MQKLIDTINGLPTTDDGKILIDKSYIISLIESALSEERIPTDEEIKIQFVIDETHLSGIYELKDILSDESISEEKILEDMEVCTCTFTESNNHCECEPQFLDSSVTSMRLAISMTITSKESEYEKEDETLLPKGTRIVFLKNLTSEANGDSPGFIYAKKDQFGVVTAHGCPEGHWVRWDGWDAAFGAELGKDFIKAI